MQGGMEGKACERKSCNTFAVELESVNPCIIMHRRKMLAKEPYTPTRMSGMRTKCMAATAIVITMGTIVPCAFAQVVMIL